MTISPASNRAWENKIKPLIVGTGSTYSFDGMLKWDNHLKRRSRLEVLPSLPHKNYSTPKEHLENIRHVLNPAISDLSILFDVSRQAIYKWLSESSNPEFEKLEKIKALSKIADFFKSSGIKRCSLLLKMKNVNGISLFELLKNNQPYEEQLKMLIGEAKAMETISNQIKQIKSQAPPTDDWKSTISIPSYNEEI